MYFFHVVYASDFLVIGFAMLIILLMWSAIGAVFRKHMRLICLAVSLITAVAILCLTIFTRSSKESDTFWIAFSSFQRAKEYPGIYRAMLMNVLLFFPLGLSLPYVFNGSTKKRLLLTILSGLLLSIFVEAVQYIFLLGLSETDDVICNTLGTALGSCAYCLSLLWIKVIGGKSGSTD